MSLAFTGGMVGWGSIASSPAGLHWQELGRTTLTGTGDSINVTGANADTTYTGDMSTGWTTGNAGSGFTLDGTNDEIDFLANYSNDNVAIDLNSLVSGSISTSKWILRFAIEMSGTASGDNIVWWNGVSSDEEVQANSTAQSFIGSGNQTQNGTTGTRTYLSMCNDDRLDQSNVQTRLQSGGSNVSDFTGKHYFEIIRDGSNFTVNQYSDSYSTLYGSKTNAVSNEGGGTLRYFISANYQQGSNVTGTLSELKFYNGITSVAGDLTAKPYMMVLQNEIGSGSITGFTSFNGDSGSNYAYRTSENGASDGTAHSQTNIRLDRGSVNNFIVANIMNVAGQEKLVEGKCVGQNTAGAGNAPERWEAVGKWSNSSDSITSVKISNASGGDFASGSEMVVLGYDPADTTGGSVWEELASVDTSTAHDVIDTGTFTNKKYLWLQCFVKGDGNANGSIIFNTDTSNTGYAMRRSYDGANESTYAGTNPAGSEGSYDGYGATGAGKYYNMFIVNNGSNEALWISQINVGEPSGANNAPHIVEWVGKWDLTDAITRIRIKNQDAGTDYDESSIKVWGFD